MAEKRLPSPDLLGQPEGPGGRPALVAPSGRPPEGGQAAAQRRMRAPPVVLEHGERHGRIPGRADLRASVRLARQAGQPVAQRAVEPLDMPRVRARQRLAPDDAYLHPHQPPPLALLDRLDQADAGRGPQRWPPAPPRPLRVAVHQRDGLGVDRPPVAHPRHARPIRCPLPRRGHDRRRGGLLAGAAAPGHDEPGGAVLAQAAPAWPHPGRRGGASARARALLLTKDQNASTSTAVRCRSCTSAAVSASAWAAAARSQRPSVSYLWPVIASAALRRPRRITPSRLRATSAAGVRSRYSGGPSVGPKPCPQPWQRQRGRPARVRPFLTTWAAAQRGQGGLSGDG